MPATPTHTAHGEHREMTSCIHDHGRWGQKGWGKGDQLGAGHFLTPERTLAALRMVKDGRIVDMSHMIEIGAPRMAPNQSPYHIQAGPTSAPSAGSSRWRTGWRRAESAGAAPPVPTRAAGARPG